MAGKTKETVFFSLQYKILLFSLVLISIPLLSMGIFSYIKSSQIVEQKVGISNLNTVVQVGNSIEFVLQDAHDTSLYLIQSEDVRNFLKLDSSTQQDIINKQKLRIEQSLMYLILSKKYINSIYIEGFNNVTLDTNGTFMPLDDETKENIQRLRGGYIWTPRTIVQKDNTLADVISLIRILNDISNITSTLAVLQINVDESMISKIYEDKVIGEKGDFIIIDEENRIISTLNKEELGAKIKPELAEHIADNILDGVGKGYFKASIEKESYLVTYYQIEKVGWCLVNLVPMDEIVNENSVIQQVIIIVIAVSFVICTLFALVFSSRVLHPLKKMRTLMKKIENEDFEVSIDIKGHDEISMLGRSFNKMSRKLNELINQVYSVQIKQREAELKALQAQINPHFLYNTLDIIYWMSRMEKAFDTCKLVEALSKLFRLSLNSGNEITTVRQEVEHLRNYIIIQQKRYEEMIDFSLSVEEETFNCKTVKLILQPLVENAIYHGIEKKGQRGCIEVVIRRDENSLVFVIKDDGCGIDTVEIERLLDKVGDKNKGFGIKNVNDRIKLYFGEQYGIEFSNNESVGTKVVVRQPYKESGEENDGCNDSR